MTQTVRKSVLLLIVGVVVAAVPERASAQLPHRPSTYLTDQAGILTVERYETLNQLLVEHERQTSNQVLVYVDRTIPPGMTIDRIGSAALDGWAVGQRGKNNGVVFFVFVQDRTMRLEVGSGLRGVLPDSRTQQITGEIVKPLFKQGDYASGVEAGARAILGALEQAGEQGTGRTVAEATLPAEEEQGSGLWRTTKKVVGFLLWIPAVFFGVVWAVTSALPRSRTGGEFVAFSLIPLVIGAVAWSWGWSWLTAFGGLAAGLALPLRLLPASTREALDTWIHTPPPPTPAAPERPEPSGQVTAGKSEAVDNEKEELGDEVAAASTPEVTSTDFWGGGGDSSGSGGSSDNW